MGLNDWAYSLSESLLSDPLPRRWAHSLGVAKRARSLGAILGNDAELLEAAAVLHDIGYSPSIAATGFHPLDGARFLRDQEGADERVVRLVAHHSCALLEAEERGFNTAMEHAIESGYLDENPLANVKRTGSRGGDVADPRVLVNAVQGNSLLTAVSYVGSVHRNRGR